MALGYTVTELQARMSSREYAEWVAYYQIEPWGDEYDAIERATIAAMVANTARDAKKHPNAYQPDDFMLRFKEPRRPLAGDGLLDKVKMINRMFGGKERK